MPKQRIDQELYPALLFILFVIYLLLSDTAIPGPF